jgi:hypothetical protein
MLTDLSDRPAQSNAQSEPLHLITAQKDQDIAEQGRAAGGGKNRNSGQLHASMVNKLHA